MIRLKLQHVFSARRVQISVPLVFCVFVGATCFPLYARAQEVTLQDEIRHMIRVCSLAIVNPRMHLKEIDPTALGYRPAKRAKRHTIYRKRENRRTRSMLAVRETERWGGDGCGIHFGKTSYEEGIQLLELTKTLLKSEGFKEVEMRPTVRVASYPASTLSLHTKGKHSFVLSAKHVEYRSANGVDTTRILLREVFE